jgi:hypothetical protein
MFNKKELIKIKKQFDKTIIKLVDRLKILTNFDKNCDILPPYYNLVDYYITDDNIILVLICHGETNGYEYDLSIPFKIYNDDKLFAKWCKDKVKQEKRKMKEIRAKELLAGIIRPNVEKMINKATEIIEDQYVNH